MELLRAAVALLLMMGIALSLCDSARPRRVRYVPVSIDQTRLWLVHQQP